MTKISHLMLFDIQRRRERPGRAAVASLGVPVVLEASLRLPIAIKKGAEAVVVPDSVALLLPLFFKQKISTLKTKDATGKEELFW
jgi:hypothetical protein